MNHHALQRRVHVAQLLLVAILVGGTVYVADTVVGGSLFRDPYVVTVNLREAGGLHEKSTVNYRGQRIGTVRDVRLSAGGVVAELAIDEGVQVPRDSEFLVRNLSAVGEQYVDIRPRTAEGPWLEDGTVIAARETETPLPIHTVIGDTQRLLERVDIADLETISREADLAFGDGAADLRGTSVELEKSFALLQDLQPDLVRLVHRGEVPLRTGVDKEGEIRRLSHNLALITAELRRADPAIRDLVDDGGRALPMLADTWRDLAPTVASLLQVAAPLAAMSQDHLAGLNVWLDWIAAQVDVMAASTRDGTGHVLLVPKSLKNCLYPTQQRDPSELSERPLPVDGRCRTEDEDLQQRGSQHVPRQ